MISNTHTVEPDYSPALDFKGAFPTRDINRSSQNGYPFMEYLTVLNELVDNERRFTPELYAVKLYKGLYRENVTSLMI